MPYTIQPDGQYAFYMADSFADRIASGDLDLSSGTGNMVFINMLLEATHPRWRHRTAYQEGDRVSPTPLKDIGIRYTCIQSGVSASLEPHWPIEPGATVEDGTAVWKFDAGKMSGYTKIDIPSYFELPSQDGYEKGGKTVTVRNDGTPESPSIVVEPVTWSDLNVADANYAFVTDPDGNVVGYVELGAPGQPMELYTCDLTIEVADNYALLVKQIDRCRVKRTTLNPSPFLGNTMSRYCFPQQNKHHYKGDQPELGVWNPDHPVTQPNCMCTFVDTGPPVIVDGPDQITQTGYYEYTAKCGPQPHSWELTGPEGIDISQWIQMVDQYYVKESDLMDPDTPEHVCVIYADDPQHVEFTLTVRDGDGAQDSLTVNVAGTGYLILTAGMYFPGQYVEAALIWDVAAGQKAEVTTFNPVLTSDPEYLAWLDTVSQVESQPLWDMEECESPLIECPGIPFDYWYPGMPGLPYSQTIAIELDSECSELQGYSVCTESAAEEEAYGRSKYVTRKTVDAVVYGSRYVRASTTFFASHRLLAQNMPVEATWLANREYQYHNEFAQDWSDSGDPVNGAEESLYERWWFDTPLGTVELPYYSYYEIGYMALADWDYDCYGTTHSSGVDKSDIRLHSASIFTTQILFQCFVTIFRQHSLHRPCGRDAVNKLTGSYGVHSEYGECLVDEEYPTYEAICLNQATFSAERFIDVLAACQTGDSSNIDPRAMTHDPVLGAAIAGLLDYLIGQAVARGYDDSNQLATLPISLSAQITV